MKIAVYGTLKKNKPLHHIISESDFIGENKVKGNLYKMWTLPILTKGSNSVEVEVYDVNYHVFNQLKRIEEGAGYKTENTTLQSGQEATVWRYPEVPANAEKINKF